MTPLQPWDHPVFREAGISIFLKRDDLAGDDIGGNKFRKLRYILTSESVAGKRGVLTFGGPYSNHLLAVAASSAAMGVPSCGVVRGEEVSNVVIRRLRSLGMHLEFMGRQAYSKALQRKDEEWLIIPPGGASPLALAGTAEAVLEVLAQCPVTPHVHAVPAGTGSTAAGMATAMDKASTLMVFPAIRGEDLEGWFHEVLRSLEVKPLCRICVDERSPGKGFARRDPELWEFIRREAMESGVVFDPVYNGKMASRILDLASEGYFLPGTVVVLYHTGGWAGREGYRERFRLPWP